MNEVGRERIRELIRILGSAEKQLHALLIDEENASEGRTAASKETEFGGRLGKRSGSPGMGYNRTPKR